MTDSHSTIFRGTLASTILGCPRVTCFDVCRVLANETQPLEGAVCSVKKVLLCVTLPCLASPAEVTLPAFAPGCWTHTGCLHCNRTTSQLTQDNCRCGTGGHQRCVVTWHQGTYFLHVKYITYMIVSLFNDFMV